MSRLEISLDDDMRDLLGSLAEAGGELTLQAQGGPVAVLLSPEHYVLLRSLADEAADPERQEQNRQSRRGEEIVSWNSELGQSLLPSSPKGQPA